MSPKTFCHGEEWSFSGKNTSIFNIFNAVIFNAVVQCTDADHRAWRNFKRTQQTSFPLQWKWFNCIWTLGIHPQRLLKAEVPLQDALPCSIAFAIFLLCQRQGMLIVIPLAFQVALENCCWFWTALHFGTVLCGFPVGALPVPLHEALGTAGGTLLCFPMIEVFQATSWHTDIAGSTQCSRGCLHLLAPPAL